MAILLPTSVINSVYNNVAIGFPILKSLRKAVPKAFLDCHLMVTDPEKWVEPLKKAGGDQMLFHYEAKVKSFESLIKKIKDTGMKAGLVLNPDTPLDSKVMDIIEKNPLDMLLIMTVVPGFGGQSFIGKSYYLNLEHTMEKVRKARKAFPNLKIEVDGGINKSNMHIPIKAGANVIVSGTGLYGEKDPKSIIQQMKELGK